MPKTSKQRLIEKSQGFNLPDAIRVNRFPWDEPEEKDNWTREDIFLYLQEVFFKWGVTREQTATPLVESLADSFFSAMISRRAIANDPMNPTVGKQSAYTLQRASISQVFNAFKYLGIYPLDTHINSLEEAEEPEEPTKEELEEDLLLG